MSVAFLRRLFCGNLGRTNINNVILENSSAWRDLTFGAADLRPPIPTFIIVTCLGEGDSSSICLDSDDDEGDDDTAWLLPKLGLRKDFWAEREIENESFTDDDLFTDDEDDDGSSYVPSPARTWQSTGSQSTTSSGAYIFDVNHPWFSARRV